ncbi:MAG: hypothetical protein ACM3S4_05475 [Burkholderiales bacterium]
MLLDSVDVAATNVFSLFGMSTSDSINAIIAVLAFAGLIASIITSKCSLNQAKKLFKAQMDITLYNERYAVTDFFLNFFSSDNWNKKSAGNISKLCDASVKTMLLFKNGKLLFDLCQSLIDYYDGKPLPDYREDCPDKIDLDSEFSDIELAFLSHALTGIKLLMHESNILKVNE